MSKGDRLLSRRGAASLLVVLALLLQQGGVAGGGRFEPADASTADAHALWLGQRVLAIAGVIRDPNAPDALATVMDLGLDSRYRTLVRGWLVMQLQGDQDIARAHGGNPSPQVAARIEFLEKAIRALDLE